MKQQMKQEKEKAKKHWEEQLQKELEMKKI